MLYSAPLQRHNALHFHNEKLSEYEQNEILSYEEIYYLGENCIEKNKTFDDERGDYLLATRDHIHYRFEIFDILGKGSFGQVVKAHDYKYNRKVALKIIRNKKRFHHQALVEVKILEKIKAKDPNDQSNIVRMEEYFHFRGHLCIVFELLNMNLYEFIKTNAFKGFSLPLVKRFASQILEALMLLHQHGIVHCDLKPENILLRMPTKSSIKVIDFGSSCFENERVYTYIQSRFYRSPEVILGCEYGLPIDMWSFGCILAELYTGYPLFPGENEQEQLGNPKERDSEGACIMEIMGTPPSDLLGRATRKKGFFESNNQPKIIANSKGKKRRPGSKTLEAALKNAAANGSNGASSMNSSAEREMFKAFVDFLKRCLEWDPSKRINPFEAARHHWIVNGSSSEPLKNVMNSITGLNIAGQRSPMGVSGHGGSGMGGLVGTNPYYSQVSTPKRRIVTDDNQYSRKPLTQTYNYGSSSSRQMKPAYNSSLPSIVGETTHITPRQTRASHLNYSSQIGSSPYSSSYNSANSSAGSSRHPANMNNNSNNSGFMGNIASKIASGFGFSRGDDRRR